MATRIVGQATTEQPVEIFQGYWYADLLKRLRFRANSVTKNEADAEDAAAKAEEEAFKSVQSGAFASKVKKKNGRFYLTPADAEEFKRYLYKVTGRAAISAWRSRQGFGPRNPSRSELEKLVAKVKATLTAEATFEGRPPPTDADVAEVVDSMIQGPIRMEITTGGGGDEDAPRGVDIAAEEASEYGRRLAPSQRGAYKRKKQELDFIRSASFEMLDAVNDEGAPKYLHPDEREVLRLYYQGYTLDEIKVGLDLPARSIRDNAVKKVRKYVHDRLKSKRWIPEDDQNVDSIETPFGFLGRGMGWGGALLAVAAVGGLWWFFTRKKES